MAGESACSQKEKSVLPQEVEHWSLTTLRNKLIKIGAKVVRHGRYVTFQLAEVAIPKSLFAERRCAQPRRLMAGIGAIWVRIARFRFGGVRGAA